MYKSLTDVTSLASLGKCDIFPRSAILDGASDEVTDSLRGADASVRSLSDKMRYLKDLGESQLSTASSMNASSMLRRFANANFSSGKASFALLNAIDNVLSKGPSSAYDPSEKWYQSMCDLLYAACPFLGLYDPYSYDREQAASHLSSWNDLVTLGFYEGSAFVLNTSLVKPQDCYVSVSLQGYPLGAWANGGVHSTATGNINITGKNFSILCYFQVDVSQDPQYSDNYNKLFWKPTLAKIRPDSVLKWDVSITDYSDDNPPLPCLSTINSDGSTGFITISKALDVLAEYIGYYDAITSLISQCASQVDSLVHSQVAAILDSYTDNNLVSMLKERFMSFQSPSTYNLLGVISTMLTDANSVVNDAGTAYTGMSSNPNYVTNLLQVTGSVLVTIGTTVLQVVGALLGSVYYVVSNLISSAVAYVKDNLDATRAKVEASGDNVLFSVAAPSQRRDLFPAWFQDMTAEYKRDLEDVYASSFATCLGPRKESWTFDGEDFTWHRPCQRTRLVPVIYSNGNTLEDPELTGRDHLVQIAFMPSANGGVPVFQLKYQDTYPYFNTSHSGNVMVSVPSNGYDGALMWISKSGSGGLLMSNEVTPEVYPGASDATTFPDDRLAFEFGAAVAEWGVRAFMAFRGSAANQYLSTEILPHITDQSCPLETIGIPGWSHNGFGDDAKWDYSSTADALQATYPTLTSPSSQWKDYFFQTGSSTLNALYLCLSFIQFHHYTGSSSARWDDVMALYTAVKDEFPGSTYKVFRQLAAECSVYSEAFPIPEVQCPAITPPTLSRRSLITSAIIVGGAIALTAVTAVVAKRTLRKAVLKSWFNKNRAYNEAMEKWNANPTASNYASLYKANRKLGKAGKWCKVMGIKSVGGWDPSGYYSSATSPIPTEKSALPLLETLAGPKSDESTTYIASLITGV